jgi:hypothetical protein
MEENENASFKYKTLQYLVLAMVYQYIDVPIYAFFHTILST